MAHPADELVLLPLGGVGEIGMNLALYGYGPPHERTWLAVDFGIGFPHANLPGVDLVFPDISYIEEERTNLAGIVITHAHEDHFGALIDLWPRLRVPVYATAFTAHLLNAKLASEPGASPLPITLVKAGDRIEVGPFDVEYINVAHSIPESHALAIRTKLGTVLHSGDWKLDPTPAVGLPTDEARLRAIGDEGVLALVCDSTNALTEGRSPSEAEVTRALAKLIHEAPARICFTTFASNVGRIRAIAMAAAKAGRDVVVAGRAMRRVIDVAAELDLLEGAPPFLDEEAFAHLPRDRVVALLSGSQGETRAALSRVASGDHPRIDLDRGDTVVFSARSIPGNELAIGNVINQLVTRGVRVVTARDGLVHTSGHPRRDEMRDMYGWIRPRIAVPVHGQPMHLAAHAGLAREMGVKTVLTIRDGMMMRLAPEPAEQVDEIDAGNLYKDGRLIGDIEDVGVVERRRLAFSGHVTVSIVLDDNGDLAVDPEVVLIGLPRVDGHGRALIEIAEDAILSTLDSIPRRRRRDPDAVREAATRSVRAAMHEAWGKKPVCTVTVAVV